MYFLFPKKNSNFASTMGCYKLMVAEMIPRIYSTPDPDNAGVGIAY